MSLDFLNPAELVSSLKTFSIFIAFLCPIVFIHELGHFLFARLFGVRVEVFSIGFGPKLFKWKSGDTEYAVSAIPLGGYVKMFGDDPTKKDEISQEDREVAFNFKGKWARFWIVFGGPLANFVMAFVIFAVLAMFGGETVPETRFGLVPSEHPYFQKGLRSGDLLKRINGQDVISLTDFALDAPQVKTMSVEREGKTIKLDLDVTFVSFVKEYSTLGIPLRSPIVLDKAGKLQLLSLSKEKLDAGLGLEEVVERQGQIYLVPLKDSADPKDFEVSAKHFDLAAAAPFSLEQRSLDGLFVELRKNSLWPLDLVVGGLVIGSSADKAKIKKGDVLTTINGQNLRSFNDLREKVQEFGKTGQKIVLAFFREGREQTAELVPEISKRGDESFYAIGIYSSAIFSTRDMVSLPSKGFFGSLVAGFKRTISTTKKMVEGFRKLIAGEASLKNIGGPIAIGKAAADHFEVSISYFIALMAMMSVNLGVINLFPIPVLDGGHILFIFLETLNGGPLSQRKMEIAQQFGFSLLLLLIFVALYNDISRLI